jgi:hypothetical protein
MAVIRTKQNMVAAYEPEAGDSVVMTRIGTARAFQPITRYEPAVREAAVMADYMQAHVDVVPMRIEEFVLLKSGMSMEDWLLTLSDATLEELRQLSIEACAEAVRYCDDPTVRAEAAAVLVKLGVVT